MKRRLPSFLLLVVMVFTCSMADFSFAAENVEKERFIIIYNEEINTELIEEVGGTVYEEFHSIDAAAALLPLSAVPLLMKLPEIKAIEKDDKVSISAQKVDWGIPKIEASRAWKDAYKGKGIKIAVLDTGISRSHSDLTAAGGVSFVSYTNDYNDDHGHGSHVAGIIGAKDNEIGTVGVAPEASLYGVKVLNSSGSGNESAIIKGIEWAIEKKMDIINLSLATPNSSTAVKLVIDKAYAQGIFIVAAAGNDLTDDGQPLPVQYPAKYPSVIAVGAINEQNKRASFSAIGPELSFAAPGEFIYSTGIGNSYFTQSGTSMAAPFAAGVLALYKQANPELGTSQLRALLQKNAVDLGAAGRDKEFGFGLIHVAETIDNSVMTASDFTDIFSSAWYINELNELTKAGYIKGYSDRTFRPSLPITRAEVVTFLGRILHLNDAQRKTAFSDVRESFYASGMIQSSYEQNISAGYPDGSFHPNAPITRGEIAALVKRAFQIETSSKGNPFSDLNKSYFAYNDIISLVEQKLLSGYPDQTFHPYSAATRAEFIAILGRASSISN
ncbi:S8 family peptidase [Bacillus taeanensis]|uniref:Alkaline serine protease n=1 Tax=Bacillus taeanensis TaxID=273032 RepID=A0A366XTX7_9BACI|nr:S8 family serine peptidase [Bacillus taeanensis]RBW67603.1 alkaline serine protease [Bacillus taeanensis]